MKKAFPILLTAVALTVGTVWYLRPSPENAAVIQEPLVPRKGPPPTRIVGDPIAIFKKAFWREPSAGDEIPHAERHEWSDAEGLTKWAWFLEVNASPDLLKYLREDNSFGLVRAPSAHLPEGPPAWFTFIPGEFSVFRSPRGNLHLLFSNQGNKLFACDSGNAFQRGAPAAATTDNKDFHQAPFSGRLPATSPPIPGP